MNYDFEGQAFTGAIRIPIPKSKSPLMLGDKKTPLLEQQTHYYMNASGVNFEDNQTICLLVLKSGQLIFEYYHQRIHPSQTVMLFSLSDFVLNTLEVCAIVEELGREPFWEEPMSNLSGYSGITPVTGGIGIRGVYRSKKGGQELCPKSYADVQELADYSHQNLWGPLGMQYDGYWNVVTGSNRFGSSKYVLSASAVDICKLLYVVMNGGRSIEGRQIYPECQARQVRGYLSAADRNISQDVIAYSSPESTIYLDSGKDIILLRLGTGYTYTSARKWIGLMEDLCSFW